jgi:hypothetical protein
MRRAGFRLRRGSLTGRLVPKFGLTVHVGPRGRKVPKPARIARSSVCFWSFSGGGCSHRPKTDQHTTQKDQEIPKDKVFGRPPPPNRRPDALKT